LKVGAFIIHLARAEGRRAHVEAMRAALPMPTEVVDAVDGALLSDAEKAAAYSAHLHRPFYPFELSASEIGCFLSHRKAWQALLDADLDAALVIEDDVDLDPGPFADGLALASQTMGEGTLVRFPYRSYSDAGVTIARSGEIRLLLPRVVGLGMQVQLVDRIGAMRLLAATRSFDRPVDTFVQLPWLHGVRVLSVQPSGVREIGGRLGGSTVQKRSGQRLWRNLRRAFYKLKLAAATRLNLPSKGP
jgi:GR25 family glycosyltransferase involved in LPS biosynthesis